MGASPLVGKTVLPPGYDDLLQVAQVFAEAFRKPGKASDHISAYDWVMLCNAVDNCNGVPLPKRNKLTRQEMIIALDTELMRGSE